MLPYADGGRQQQEPGDARLIAVVWPGEGARRERVGQHADGDQRDQCEQDPVVAPRPDHQHEGRDRAHSQQEQLRELQRSSQDAQPTSPLGTRLEPGFLGCRVIGVEPGTNGFIKPIAADHLVELQRVQLRPPVAQSGARNGPRPGQNGCGDDTGGFRRQGNRTAGEGPDGAVGAPQKFVGVSG